MGKRKQRFRVGVGILLGLWVVLGVHQASKPMPEGIDVASEERKVSAESVEFLVDKTYIDKDGVRHSEQEIFDEVFSMIDGAQERIVIDMFLYNSFQGDPPEATRGLSGELTDKLIAKKGSVPEVEITVISDPINIVYGGLKSEHFERLKSEGINVIITDLDKLRASNPAYSGPWQAGVKWLGNSANGGWLTNPFDKKTNKVSLRSWLRLLNFKANHRKLIVADEAVLITSANPHDGSSAHSNTAVKVSGKLWFDALESEKAVANFSGGELDYPGPDEPQDDGPVTVQLVTEAAIRDNLVALLRDLQAGDRIDVLMFYLSERNIVNELVSAANRGAEVRIILDANKDAFGHVKNGVPNRPVAKELLQKTDGQIQIRWCDTHGEQCHGKMIIARADDKTVLTTGSANLTRRNIGNFNLETNVWVETADEIEATQEAQQYFEEVWENREGRVYTTEYETYKDESAFKYWMYRFQEMMGLSSF